MTWHVQRLNRNKGSYYSAIYNPTQGQKRSVTLGYLPRPGAPESAQAPEPSLLTALLRAHDPTGSWQDGMVLDALCYRASGMGEEEAVGAAMVHPRPQVAQEAHPVAPLPTPTSTSTPSQTASQPVRGASSGGGMLLRDYVEKVWYPVLLSRSTRPETPCWWWERRILPALGNVRLTDLTPKKWSDFLNSMSVGGSTKHVCQTTYRTALTHAEELGWIPFVHKFPIIPGGTKRTTKDPEPMSIEEVEVFLDAVDKPRFRALFGVQIGQGLRPAEALRIRWEDIDWQRGTLFVRGSKNDLAKATVPLTPLSRRELLRWWELRGKPTEGIVCTRTKNVILGLKLYPRNTFYHYAEKSGLNEDRARQLFPYICRHSFATIAAVSGIDRAFTKDMMRHSRQSKVLDEAYIKVSKLQTATAFAGFGSR